MIVPATADGFGEDRDAMSGSRRLGRVRFAVWSTSALVVVTDRDTIHGAQAFFCTQLAALDAACNRFRADSEISRLCDRAGTAVSVSPLLGQVLDVALRAARLTDGLVDPTVGAALAEWGYDRDFAAMPLDGPLGRPMPAPGWWRIIRDQRAGTVLIPRGTALDLGATAKAWASDQAARGIARRFGCGVLISLGGDVAAAGPAPEGGWRVRLGDDHTCPDPDGQMVILTEGGLATSGVTRRRWRRAGISVHHIIDPRSGWPAAPVWRTASVAADDCVDANVASTAAIVLGTAAPRWLAGRELPGRLISSEGAVRTVGGWPTDDEDGAR